jgi:hypothetical protein
MILDNIFAISPQQLDIIAEKIYQNECACKREYLVWWSENEEFPSLGIEIPEVLKNYNKGCIWTNRNEYLDPKSADQIEQIKIWLENTKDIQAQFLYQRALNMLEDIIDYDPATRIDIEKLFALDIGKFAVIDYINFKGSGLNFTERYGHHGWGLLQVLQNMKFNPDPVDAFIKSAIEVLKMRIKAAPPERNEKVFLNSWIKRFESYRKF